MQDQPSLAELVCAAREFLSEHALPKLSGHTAFHARVAANVLRIVERQLVSGEEHESAEVDRLEALLGDTGSAEDLNRQLCRRIRSGEFGLDTPGLFDHLWTTTIGKIAIDQPKYSGYKKALGDAKP